MINNNIQPLEDILERLDLTKKDRIDLEKYISREYMFDKITEEDINKLIKEGFNS